MSLPDDFYAVVLAGGRGTRFWPLSRRARPKQCLSLDGGPTLLQQAVARTELPPERVIVVTGPDMEAAVRAQVPGVSVLVEPAPRNTAAPIAWAALEVERRGGRGCVVLPSDHVVRDAPAFRAALSRAARAAGEEGALVTLGVVPTRPETGFGWIEADGDGAVRRVRRFVEKPPHAEAERLLATGCLWNAGMFAWTNAALLGAVSACLPGTAAMIDGLRDGAAIAEVWPLAEDISVDHGVLERTDGLRVVPMDVGWSDAGSWPALRELLADGEGGVGVAREVLALDAAGNVVHAPGRVVALVGVEELVVVATEDAVLVVPVAQAQRLREVLAELERRGVDVT